MCGSLMIMSGGKGKGKAWRASLAWLASFRRRAVAVLDWTKEETDRLSDDADIGNRRIEKRVRVPNDASTLKAYPTIEQM